MELLSTSGIVLLVCVLAGLYLVSRRMKPQGATTIGAEKYAADVVEETNEQGLAYEAADFGQVHDNNSVEPVSYGLVPRWGRLAIFSVACFALLLALVTGIMSMVGSGSFVFPLTCMFGAASALTFLRVLAIRDRDRRRARTVLNVEKTRKIHLSSTERDTQEVLGIFPQLETSSIELRHVPERPARARQQLPVSHAAKALRKARTHSSAPMRPDITPSFDDLPSSDLVPRLRMDEPLPTTTWQVTEVPRPTYLDVSIAHRDIPTTELPEPEQLSQTKTLAEAASLNLDDVLKRRRA